MKKIYIHLLLLVVLLPIVSMAQVVTVPAANTNTGSVNDPLGTYWGFERSAMIYTSAQIGASTGNITSVGFYVNSVSTPGNAVNVRIYMKMRTTLMTANTTYATEISGATLVYGPTTIPSSSFVAGQWVTLPLSTPFNYTGGTNHLEVIVETNATATGNEGSTGKQFRYSSPGNSTSYQFWNGDNSAPTGNGSRSANRPNIQLNFAAITACSGTPDAGTASISSTSGCSGSAVTLSATGLTSGSGISYQWQSAPAAGGPWTNIAGATSTTASVTPSETTFYRLVTTCSTGGATNTTNVVSFTVTSCLNVPSSGSNSNPCGTNVSLFDSGGSGGNYVNNSNGFTVLENGGSAIITLSGTSSGEACCDYVRIFRGVGTGGVLVGTYYMNSAIPTITSVAGEALTVQFVSDGSVVGAGFQINATYSGSCVPTSPPSCASSPTAPANGATGVSVGTTLSWPAVAGATGYDVYFGTSANPPLVSTNQAGTTYNPGTLNASTLYYWIVVPRNSVGLATGCATWSFTTGIPGCTNGVAYLTVTPTCNGTQQTYSTCTYAGEYNTLNLTAGTPYTFGSATTTDYLTITNSAGVILAAGTQPVSFTPSASGAYRVYVHLNSACGTDASCHSTWVVCGSINWKSQWISMNTGPSNWCAGETRNISVTVRNDGSQTWTNANPDINIGVKWNQEADYFVRVDANNLAPGASQTYNFTVTAPLTNGTNNLSFDVVNEGNFWFANNAAGVGPGNVVYTSAPITINAFPTVSAGSGATVCPATSVQLNGSASSSQTVTIGTVTGNDLIYPFNTLWHDARSQFIVLSSELTALGLTAGNITAVGFNVNYLATQVMNGFTVKMKNTSSSTLANWETGLSNVFSGNYAVAGLGVQTINFQNPFVWDGTSNVVIEFCFDNSSWTDYSYIDYWNTGTNRMLFRAVDGDVGCNLTAPFVGTNIPVFRFTGNGNTPVSWTSSPAGFTSTIVNPTVTPSLNTTYTITGSNNGCTSSANTTVTVNNPTLSTPPTTGDMVWRGASNTDWAILGNWWQYNGTSYVTATAAPTIAQNVIVPANQTCVLNQPNTFANAGSAKNLRIESGATLTMGSGSLTVSENWVNNGTFVPGSGTVTFAGTGTHTISGSAAAHNFNSLTMNKTGEVQLNVPIAMTGTLTLTNGRLNIGNFNLDLASNTVNGGNSNSYVRTSGTGVLMRNVGASMVEFPVGSAAYNPASIANAGTLDDKFNVRVIDNVTDDGTAVGTPTTQAVVNRTWMVNEGVTGGSNVTLRLHWNGAAEEINGFSPAAGFIAHYIASEGMWDNIGFTAVGTGYFETNNITSFSPFTISSSGAFAPLPVELIAFTAHCQNEDVEVKWSTASEFNSQHYVLQVSEDGYSWSDLYVIEAAGFSTTVLEYSYIHKNAARTKNYYRLRQYDNDGTVETYNTIMSSCTSDENVFMTFPNPSADAFTVVVNDKLLSGSNVLNISDASGKLIYSIAVDLENGSGSFALEGLDLPAGLYYLQLNNGSYASRIIKHSFR